MNYLYLLINLATISVPLIASYHSKIQFYKNHRKFFLAIAISGLLFILWDVFFAQKEVWGFSDSYTLGFGLFGLPVEEWFFFLCIPYASLFLHFQLHRFGWLSPLKLSDKQLLRGSALMLLFVVVIGVLHYDRWYTFVNALFFVLVYSFALCYQTHLLKMFLPSFVAILIPFFMVNGILTGSLLEEPVVWYDNDENLGMRIGTVPVEDLFYAFSMLMLPLMIYSKLLGSKVFDLKTAH
jgi:lycopene cyclase domain-containing protein